MKVFKFGGASIKSAEAIKNMSRIISKYADEKLLVVVSAMGKSTNALENILNCKFKNKDHLTPLSELKNYHVEIMNQLFEEEHNVFGLVNTIFDYLEETLAKSYAYDKMYDQTVSCGELLSSTIIAEFLKEKHIRTHWLDARDYIKTNANFREGLVDWHVTEELIKHDVHDIAASKLIITQGFIGSTSKGETTTLGREGSDFTAAIFASALEAEHVCVWKDVPGILNADPKLVPDAILFAELPYHEAAEMTYYGASVIHPKTIKPLANKHIPLLVKSFDKPDQPGTIIHDCTIDALPPCTIIKNDQVLISFKVLDFTFVNEENLSLIFHELSQVDLKINIMQNSAISFSIVVDNQPVKIDRLIEALKPHFEIRYNTGLQLVTVKNYTKEKIDSYGKMSNILLEQISRNNYRILTSPSL
ncbi:aspartate kinase [Fulvivirga sp. RKSG066]|uniref:aspartate kinase n=1 Tax=Fulvivirga aurantia TaxID=2529383 RepID=UPI0012BC2BE5|nr:aspartate kinase [Fulvivirga aurantia]MTI22280.1 aspartate kinase [Fulvivirga aurantia]